MNKYATLFNYKITMKFIFESFVMESNGESQMLSFLKSWLWYNKFDGKGVLNLKRSISTKIKIPLEI
jgi:hypothetical protein